MSTATIDAPKPAKASAPRLDRTRLSVQSSGDATEQAVSQLVRACYGAVNTIVPPALARPTETVSLVFDVLDQIVGAGRRFSLEVAELLESGLAGAHPLDASESRAA
ncbi:MAG: hypothetical protein NVS3B26_16290 [Mycobacteriales bacterium]